LIPYEKVQYADPSFDRVSSCSVKYAVKAGMFM
jgi:hypothetical protein